MDPSFGAEKVVSFEEARSRGLLKPSSTLSVENIVGLCDHLLMAEVLLSSTLFVEFFSLLLSSLLLSSQK